MSHLWQDSGDVGAAASSVANNGSATAPDVQRCDANGYFSSNGNCDSYENYTNGSSSVSAGGVPENGGGGGGGGDGGSNNNYVNFNQFILQHNFVGNASPNVMQSPLYEYGNHENAAFVNFGLKPAATTAAAVPTTTNYAFETLFPKHNIFQYNNGVGVAASGTSTAGDTKTSNNIPNDYEQPTTSQSFYNNYYTPFENIGGVNYFANPFATGFDVCAGTNLQADAPEFVPSFAKMNLNAAAAKETKAAAGETAGGKPTSSAVFTNGNEASASGLSAASAVFEPESKNTLNGNLAKTQTQQQQQQQLNNNATGAMSKQNYRAGQSYTPAEREREPKVNGSRQRGGASVGGGARRSLDYRDEREDRYGERYEKKPQKQQRYDNHRSNKRRDDWNRNRDRINGFRVDDLDNSNESPLHSPEKKSSPKKNVVENEKLSRREKLIREVEMRRLECLVCVETIKSHQGVWSCQNCFHIMHLKCIITWASSSKSELGWRCPACQHVSKDVPRDYYCFCGKMKNPPCNRQDLAHTCGEVCCRVGRCPHACALLCHPGPCPPCQAMVQRTCGCGKSSKTLQCAMKEPIECDEVCEKTLNCEQHQCKEKCHEGKCPSCEEKVNQICHCTKQERQVVCTRETHDKHVYSCGKPCGRELTCGNHKCKDCCHAGSCRTCKMSPTVVTSCPCGKMPVLEGQRKSCLDPIPTCEGVCGKTLRCGKSVHPHQCTSKCHLGNCPPCNKQTAVKCRCGHMDQMIKCRQLSTRADDARCKKRCTKKRSCGKHKCNQECCIDIDHICPLPCNYTLSCNKHKCDQPCHRGNCPPCYRSSFEELYCECGAEVIMPPVACGTKRPLCKKPCSRPHRCEHPPQHNCHSGPSCPPCMIFTVQSCFGNHETRKTIPCSQNSYSCGFPCNTPLPCGRHKCIKACHEGICQAAGEICKQSCTKPRAQCGHKCLAMCHEGDCPETPCKEMVEVQCECGHRKQHRVCHELAREFSRIATAQLASSMAEMQRGNYMELSEILAPVKLNKTNKTLDCNEECRLIERNRRLAIGLQVRNPDAQQRQTTKYSEFVRSFAKRNPTLVKSVYDTLTNLVKLAKESKQKSRSHSFPTMNREKRQLVHELCEMFNVDSVSYDAEPNRNVVATAYREKAWLPATSIMEVIQRESGQRRVPVPSNNAWGLKK